MTSRIVAYVACSLFLWACKNEPKDAPSGLSRGFQASSQVRAAPGDISEAMLRQKRDQLIQEKQAQGLRLRSGDKVVELPAADLAALATEPDEEQRVGASVITLLQHAFPEQFSSKQLTGGQGQVQFVSGDGTVRQISMRDVVANAKAYRFRLNQRGEVKADLPDNMLVVASADRERGGSKAQERRQSKVEEIVVLR